MTEPMDVRIDRREARAAVERDPVPDAEISPAPLAPRTATSAWQNVLTIRSAVSRQKITVHTGLALDEELDELRFGSSGSIRVAW